ncbi:MAG: amidohydrolase [Lautropia sp.]
MESVKPEWLAQVVEDVLDPRLPICDPHHHLWTLHGRYLLDELVEDLASGHDVVSTVYVECGSGYAQDGATEMQPVGETIFVESVVPRSGAGAAASVAAGIVGYANLALGTEVSRVLEAHLAASPRHFRGIRGRVTWDPSPEISNGAFDPRPGWLMDEKFRLGVSCLRQYDLTFDAWLFHHQLPELKSLAIACPDVAIAVNHAGAPLGVGPYAGKRKEVMESWRRGMAELATCPNVFVKLGGLGMPRFGFGWHMRPCPPSSHELCAATAPYYRFCIEQFGPHRCMFESNFPADKVSCSYGVLWNSFKLMTKDLSESERRQLFYGTAASFYRLGSPVLSEGLR